MTHNYTFIKSICAIAFSLLLFLPVGVHAEAQDTLIALRHFIQVCNSYQQLPLQVNIVINNSTNLVTATTDTSVYEASFCLQKNNTYIHVGEVEQLTNDSILLMVNNRIHRMMLKENHLSSENQLNHYTALFRQDSSVTELSKKYESEEEQLSANKGMIILTAKIKLRGTLLPKEDIRLLYNASTGNPVQLIFTRRSLLPINDSDMDSSYRVKALTDHIVTLNNTDKYIVKEQVCTFTYKYINHDTAKEVPAKITDRIVKNNNGKYIPGKGYEAFNIDQNL